MCWKIWLRVTVECSEVVIYSCTIDYCLLQVTDENAEHNIGHCASLFSKARLSSLYLEELLVLSGSINHRAVNWHCTKGFHSPFPFCRWWGHSVACSCSLYLPGAVSGLKNKKEINEISEIRLLYLLSYLIWMLRWRKGGIIMRIVLGRGLCCRSGLERDHI